ncbi:MAG: beta strand repeat-containing protein [Terriglobales bacterium]
MRRGFAVNNECFRMATEMVTFLVLVLLSALALSTRLQAQGPVLTTISDTVYRADGTAASGTVLISWPSFLSAAGDAVSAGNLAVTIGPLGAFTAQLVPNVGATPAGTYYVAVFQLDDGTVRTEYWSVPTTSPVTIAEVLSTPGTGLGNLAATQQYVNAAVAPLAIDATVVHLAGSETITGTKQFVAPPSLPAPVQSTDAANKGYVDAAVENVGAGAYVPLAGGTMTGPLSLPGDPTSPSQAADRNYVDNGLAVKAGLVNGTVPPGELGAGVASSATCLNGNSTWGSCGGGAPAGITYATTALNWTQTMSSPLTGGTQATVTLTPCPTGIDTTSGAGYQVLLSGGGNSEAVRVISAAGGCMSGAGSGTITFTPFYSYAAGSAIGSASSGIQETLNAGCGVSGAQYNNSQCNVTIPANGPNSSINIYNVYGTIYLHSNQSILSGYGTSLNCLGRGACLQIGDLVRANNYTDNTVAGLSFRTPVNVSSNASFAGVAITQTQLTSQVVTITTASAHGFRVGDMVTILFTDNSSYWGDATITAVPNPTTFQYARTGANIPAQTSPGIVALAYVAVLDNAMDTHLMDISYDKASENGSFNNFFDMWDDENATIDHFNNQGVSLNANGNWTGSFVFSAGNQSLPIAPVITLRDSTITANYSNGVTDYNSNGLYIENTILQATGPWEVYAANYTGNYQGAYLKNIYSEDSNALNPQSPVKSPFPGLGIAGLIAGASSGSFELTGNGGTTGAFASGGTGSIPYTYFIVANDTTTNVQTSPMQIMSWLSTGTDSIPVRWPRVANGADAISYDVIRIATPGTVGSVFPYNGGCPGGAGGICGYVAKGLTQAAACSSGFVCTYTDSGSSSTSAYTVKPGHYNGPLNFWPGAIVSVSTPVVVDRDEASAVAVGLFGNPLQIASLCANDGVTSPGGYTTCLASMTVSNNAVPNQTATLLSDGANVGNGMTLTKGRLNFTGTPGALISAHHIITLLDSQPSLTQSTWGFRPPASANDTWIGTDTPGNVYASSGQLAFGAPLSITNYIAQTGDGIHPNWLERLTGSLKEFNVPAQFDQSVTLPGLSNGCLNVVSGLVTSTGSACGSGGGGGSVSSVFGRTGAVVATTGDYSVAQVTGAAADATVVHLANAETITGAKTFTSNVAVSGNLLLPAGSGYVPAVGGIGLDTAAGLPVVNIGGTPQQVALTSSNISGQAGTALALAAAPTQCSGSFATGIAANGNANCTTPDIIQLPETTQPAGIANWGVFWFDSGTHTPRAIDNDHVIQLGYTNLFNSDPGGDPLDNLEELNGGNPQNLRVYSNFVNSTTWTRMSLGYDSASGYQVLRSEDANSGNALGLGMYIGSSLKWGFAATGALKPSTDNSYDIGTDSGQAMRSVFAKTSFNMYSTGRQDFEFSNDGTNGTTLNSLAVYNSGASGVQTAATSSTDGVVGIVSAGAGTSNKAVITWAGLAVCNFDAGSPVAGDYVIASTTQAGKCHDTGSTIRPTGVQVIGRIEGGNVRVSLGPPSGGGGGGAVSSVFGRTGAVTAATGDYSVAQVTGAAVDSTVVHLAGTETITGAKTFSSTVTLSGNLNVAGNINQTGSGPTQWSGVEWTGTSVTVPSGMNFSLGVGSDNTFHCQLTSGASCMPTSGGMVWPGAGIANSTGSGWGTSYAVGSTGSDIPQLSGGLLLASEIPNNAANTTGTAGGLSGTPTLPNGTLATTQSVGDNSTKLATTAYVKSETYFNWTCPVAGSTSASQNCSWTLPAGLTITGFDFAANTAPVGCTTYPVVQVWDGTAGAEVGSYSIPLTSGNNFYSQVTGSTNVTSGHTLRIKVTTAASGCSTNAGGMVATVTYQMQN